jgi:ATP-dependent Clp protease adaptor protein ClpS
MRSKEGGYSRQLDAGRFSHPLVYSRKGKGKKLADKSLAAVAEPEEQIAVKSRPEKERKPKRQPPYNVVLWDDDEHTYEYVIRMMKELFGHSSEKGFQIAELVDKAGKAVCLTTTREHAELKRDQIHAFGRDPLIPRCQGSMSATIEPLAE